MSLPAPPKPPCPPKSLANDRWISCAGFFVLGTLLAVAFGVTAAELLKALYRALGGVP